MSIYGSLTVRGVSGYGSTGDSCSNVSDMVRTVTVYDETGKIVGSSSVSDSGVAVPASGSASYGLDYSCRYSYTVTDVPDDSAFYRISADTSPGVTFNADEVREGANIVTGP